MIIVDKKLEKLEQENRPIRVGLVGAGFAGCGFALQLLTINKGMRLVAIANRTVENAKLAFTQAGATDVKTAANLKDLNSNIKENKFSVCEDHSLLTGSGLIDVIVEATGEVEYGAKVAIDAINNGKHLVLINAELDGTLGPVLKAKAIERGVIYTQADGDQPAQLMNLYRYVGSIGFKPVLLGNIKSLIDHYRTPVTQAKFAEEHFQRPKHITSFADGTKISFEMATIANGTGFDILQRGMTGTACKRVEEAYKLFPVNRLLARGRVDYILGAEPSFGVFVLGYSENPVRAKYMDVYKMGKGPLYTFYIPHHLSPLEAPLSVARAVLFSDPALSPKNGPVCDVITIAKKDLKKGELLDGIGGFTTYGTIENSPVCLKDNLLPMGLSDKCKVIRNISKDNVIRYGDVELPEGRISDRLRKEQNEKFK